MRSWRWVKRVLLSVLVSIVLYTLWLVAEREWSRRSGERELAETVALIEADDPDWQWGSLNAARKFPPDDQNAALIIPKIKAMSS
jgi:hypothetical protein